MVLLMKLYGYRLSYDTASAALQLILSLVAVAVLLWLCYLLSKYIAKKAGGITNSNNIKILERVSLAQDKGLVIAEICGTVYLISFSSERVEILKELDGTLLKQPKQATQQNFMEALNSALKGRWDLTGYDRKHKNGGS